MATSAATVEDIMSNKMPSDWREQLKAMPEVQAARAEFARDFAQVRALQKLQLPPSHIWLYQSQTSFDAVPPLVAFLQELGFGQQHLSPELETTSHLSQLSLCDASTFHTLVSPLSPQQRKDLGLLSVGSSENDDKSAWLDALAKLALQPAVTLLVLFHFRPILIDIAARWILLAGFDGQKFAHSQSDDIFHILQAFSVVLGYHHALFP